MPTMDNNPKPSILKATREEKGLTLDIVHEATKVPLDALKAIEEGYSVRLMTPFYYRGFIKIYAEFLGLDSKEVQRLYGLEAALKKTSASAAVIATAPKKIVKPKAPPNNYAKEQAQEWLSGVFTQKNLVKFGKFIGVLIVIFFLFRMTGCIINGIKSKLQEKPKTAVVKSVKKPVVKKEEKAPAVVVEPAAKVPQGIKAESTNNKVRLVVRALKDTSVQVKADGKVVFQMTMKKGTMESWDAKQEILLSGKNINELDMEVNGSHVGALGSDQRRARKVRITKEGLTVNK